MYRATELSVPASHQKVAVSIIVSGEPFTTRSCQGCTYGLRESRTTLQPSEPRQLYCTFTPRRHVRLGSGALPRRGCALSSLPSGRDIFRTRRSLWIDYGRCRSVLDRHPQGVQRQSSDHEGFIQFSQPSLLRGSRGRGTAVYDQLKREVSRKPTYAQTFKNWDLLGRTTISDSCSVWAVLVLPPRQNSILFSQKHVSLHRSTSLMDYQRLQSRLRDLPSTKRWTIGTAIFREPESDNPTILLLQRVGLETTFPNIWEIPCGQIEEKDETIAHAIRREVRETTSLNVASIIGEIEPMTWESKSSSNIQLNYIVTVQPGGSVETNPVEHMDCVWARLEELDYLQISSAMKTVIQDAFIFLADME